MNSAEAGLAKSFIAFAQLKQTRFYRLQSVLIGRYLTTSLIYRAIAYVVRVQNVTLAVLSSIYESFTRQSGRLVWQSYSVVFEKLPKTRIWIKVSFKMHLRTDLKNLALYDKGRKFYG